MFSEKIVFMFLKGASTMTSDFIGKGLFLAFSSQYNIYYNQNKIVNLNN